MITTDNLARKFENKTVLEKFSYTFTGGCYCVLGPNGSGKSTLLKILAGLDSEYGGSVSLPENNNTKRTYLPDVPKYHPFIKGREFLEMVSKIRGIDLKKYLDRFAEDFKLHEILDLKLEELSLGQTKRLFCCITLIDEAPIWVLDEPSNGLDKVSRKRLIKSILDDTSNGGIVIMSEHNAQKLREIGEYHKIDI